MSTDPVVVEEIRALSRAMVREWGFMGGAFAGTDLSPSAVHALIEIEKGGVTARELGARLRLEKSSVSRMLRKLVASGEVEEAAAETDGRVKRLSLTAAGKARVAAIHAFARAQVVDALGRLGDGEDRLVLDGLRLYSRALGVRAGDDDAIEIVPGYRPGLIARITEMHARYYAREHGLGRRFESLVADGLAEFCGRPDSPRNAVWTARQGGEIVGSLAIDGEDLGAGIAHLRWFIVDDSVRGSGAGKRLLDTALAFADERGFAETHLSTFAGLDAARHLYESRGFVLDEEHAGRHWGKELVEQSFVRRRK
ncbi:Transcriptional regulator, MarR family with acetyltransferase activity [uncultured Pleomorphomonas sp.]|uniref:Transcriptional regulator, MarR family with acetyltransferase activity n=1 Tax=uncultured Pleomorphomonas sp. TaxID=442121 RepID=A0A212LNY7_9HYPH|nr:helix-turn-helix domain-containing GNAT family N-acetyltransferase [uncultured Pleomorphomonas sp.]SCM79238.1 Transcriptional regulator, MarR family with acetyltransferase activity [uncultured Pleomorphomonas sp.]